MPNIKACDLCYPEAINEVADELIGRLKEDGRRFRLLLCEVHVKGFVDGIPTEEPTRGKAFAARLEKSANGNGRRALPEEDLPPYGKLLACPYCDKSAKNPQGIAAHVRTVHTKAEYNKWRKGWITKLEPIREARAKLLNAARRKAAAA